MRNKLFLLILLLCSLFIGVNRAEANDFQQPGRVVCVLQAERLGVQDFLL